jgi:glutamate racemase
VIGVFDSGHGGLTVLRALVARLPERVFLYLGDHRHAPYGEREDAEIIDLTRASVTRLFDRGCRLVLLACNTAAAVALRRLQQDWLPGAYPERRVLGVFVPMVEAVTEVPWHLETPPGEMRTGGTPREPPPEPATVGVFATRRTVASGAYPREIAKRAPQIRVVQQACPGLVGLIETGAGAADLEAAIAGHVGDFMARLGGAAPDSVILGCTHYPLVAGAFQAALSSAGAEGVRLHSQPELVADSLAAYLARHGEFDAPSAPRAATQFLTTGDPAAVSALAKRFFGAALRFQRI